MFQALEPNHIIAGGIPTETLPAMIAVSKYDDGSPLYRQAGISPAMASGSIAARCAMDGIVGFEFEPLAEHVLTRITQAERIFADETTLPTLLLATARPKMRSSGLMLETIGRLRRGSANGRLSLRG